MNRDFGECGLRFMDIATAWFSEWDNLDIYLFTEKSRQQKKSTRYTLRTTVRVHLPVVLNKDVWVHLVDVKAGFLSGGGRAIYANNRYARKRRIVQRTWGFERIIDLVDSYA